MPLYTVSTNTPLAATQKQTITQGVTHIHCTLTGAPAQFVQVLFVHGIKLEKHLDACVTGSIRSGRSQTVKQGLIEQFDDLIASNILPCNNQKKSHRERVKTTLLDVPAKWVIEGGEIMPEPGEETEWLARHTLS